MTIIALYIILGIIALIVILLHFSVNAYIKLDDDGFKFKLKYLFFNIYPRNKKEKKLKTQNPSENKPKKEKNKVEEKFEEFKDELDDDFEIESDEITETVEEVSQSVPEQKQKIEISETIKTDDKEIKAELKEKVEVKEKTNDKIPKKIKKVKEEKKEKIKSDSKFDKLKAKYYKIKPYIPMSWKYFKKLLKAIRITDLKLNIDVGREDAHEAAIYYGTVSGTLFNILGLLGNIFTLKVKKADVNCVFTKNTIDGNGECYVRVRPSTLIAIAVCVAVNFLIIYLKQKKTKKSENIIDKNVEIKTEVELNG